MYIITEYHVNVDINISEKLNAYLTTSYKNIKNLQDLVKLRNPVYLRMHGIKTIKLNRKTAQ